MSLHISTNLTLPLDAATGTFAILATKGAGKSNAGVVLAEEMYDAGIPWVAIDPKGDWWGIRSSANGSGPGLPIIVFGGRHGDIPLEPTAGALIADLVLTKRLTCVLDVSQFTKADATRFLLAFGRHLFIHADDDGAEPLHLLLEEAHEYLPQMVKGDQAHLVDAWQRIVKQGRFKGLGVTLISQRSSVLNKDVLELIDTLIVLRTIGPRSRASIRDWVKGQDVDEGLLDSLPTLADGEAWVWSPGELRIMQRIRFRRRRTFDSGATPKVGTKRREPSTLADIDLGEIKERMAETIEKAAAEDPKTLRKRIATLERQLAARPTAVAPEPVVEFVEIALLDETLVERVEKVFGGLADLGAQFQEAASVLAENIGMARTITQVRNDGRPRSPAPAAPPRTPATIPLDDSVPRIGKNSAEGKVLAVLSQYPTGRTREQLAFLTGFSAGASTVGVALSKLRKAGFVEPGVTGMPAMATAEGVAYSRSLGSAPLPEGDELRDYWLGKFGDSAEGKVLRELIRIYPESASKDELAEWCGYSPTASTIGVAMSKLRKIELAKGWAAHPDFIEATS